MIKIVRSNVFGWEAAIRGMRNPMNSWANSDTLWYEYGEYYDIMGNSGPAYTNEEGMELGFSDEKLMLRLARSGTTHSKFRRMIVVTCDIIAPLYWWKEFDTYKVGTVANSCSTMHKLDSRDLTMDDFSTEHLTGTSEHILQNTIDAINMYRGIWLKEKDKDMWWQMIQLLPSSYNQMRTVMLNYEVLANIYMTRKDHKLDEWREFCKWIETLPHSNIITVPEE